MVRDGLEGAVPWLTQSLREGGLHINVASASELGSQRPADAVLIKIPGADPVETIWKLHRQGHRSIVAVSRGANSQECIRLLNAGADYYLDAWMPSAELIARIRVVLRFTGWKDRHAPVAASIQAPPPRPRAG